jgi:hypothetical protein
MADQPGVDDLVEDGRVVAAPLRLAAQAGARVRRRLLAHLDLRGRATSSPPQFGQVQAISSPQVQQNVHS